MSNNIIKGCRVLTEDQMILKFPFSTHEIFLNASNCIGIEFNHEADRIRIDGIVCTDSRAFRKMMEVIIILAEKKDLSTIYFADHLGERILSMFNEFGFSNESVEPFNYYLSYRIID